MLCEMCGTETEAPSRVRVEGSVLWLCSSCSRFGTVLEGAAPGVSTGAGGGGVLPVAAPRSRRLEERDLFADMPELELLPDWGKRVREAREKLGWTPDELGQRLNEKRSLVLKLEAGGFHPSDAVVRKVEKILQIRLRARPGES
jgi:putative transcription factor